MMVFGRGRKLYQQIFIKLNKTVNAIMIFIKLYERIQFCVRLTNNAIKAEAI